MSTHIFTPITDRFGYGKYLDLEIVIDSDTGYINASKLCQLGGKKLKNWLRLDSAKELMDYAGSNGGSDLSHHSVSYEIKNENIMGISKSDQDAITGTYFHRKLIVHIAQWISCKFAMKVSDIIDDYVSRENNRMIRELKGENKTLLDRVDDLTKQNNELLVATRTIIDMNHSQNNTLAKQDKKLDMLTAEVNRIRRHLDNSEVDENKRESILVYRLEHDGMDTMRIRCGTNEYLSKFRYNARWYKEYDLISNSKRALNYLKSVGYLNKQTDAKFIIGDREHRIKLLQMLRKVNDSYK